MTLDEAIANYQGISNYLQHYYDPDAEVKLHITNGKCIEWFTEVASWLTELKELREQIQKAKAMLLDSSYTVDIMCNKISGTIGCEKCTYYNPETHGCEVRAYISKTRAFVKGAEALALIGKDTNVPATEDGANVGHKQED